MLSILHRGVRLCDGITRREALRVGGLGFTGLMLSDWLRGRASAGTRAAPLTKNPRGGFGKAKSCVMVFNYGGPSHLDMWDLKPDAPPEIRGEFKPIATRVVGTSITEHLPRLAAMADKYSIIRSVNHRDNDHAIGAYYALTGYHHPKNAILGIEPPATAQDMPSLGAIVSKMRTTQRSGFAYVTLGDLRHFGNNDSMGQNAGCLGKAYDPFTVPFVRPMDSTLEIDAVTSQWANVENGKLGRRQILLGQMSGAAPPIEGTAAMRALDGYTRKAFSLLSSPSSRDAFNLAREPQKVRDFYGRTPFSQNCLLARRLVEAGVPLVTIYSYGNRDWDTHENNFQNLKNTLLPVTDRGLSALLEDLEMRGLLDETLVVWMGDMGRTPRINKGAGRDHWSFCYSIVMAGAGIKPGQVFGSSDRAAAYPSTSPVSPADIAATIYHALGIDTRAQITDQQGRPLVVGTGTPIHSLLG